ncbi:hypothetical protein CTI12_AA083380 [Artemisia annua]|uniref:Uncharacterized protein n=1 Tax=Artemisia annua TaxID=35608 RepID=A0A2U1PML2_ARTAN|nr:hypothetical protein CTI12_AA083380 [Artemisia annua]
MDSYENICSRIAHTLYYLPRYPLNITLDDVYEIHHLCREEASLQYDTQQSNVESGPMVWIGIYIAIASLVCTLAMAADLLHGIRNKKFWFPCKSFTLNAASITVITVAMKLPVDLTSEMPGAMDQAAKVGSLALMCTIMVNLFPSLASMDNKTLLANVIGLSILVITVIVNVIIQLHTRIINFDYYSKIYIYYIHWDIVACIYLAMITLLLVIMISSSLTIPTSKEILEFKYQATNKTSSTDQQETQMSKVEKLRQHVRRFWVMAETGSPQFVMVSSPLSTASGVICVFVLLMQTILVFGFLYGSEHSYGSVYKRSTLFILVTQSIGVVVGTIAPMARCFSVLSFKIVTKWDRNHFMVFKVEKYWTQKLYEWKQNHISFSLSSRRSKTILYNLKNIALSLCIGFQKVLVVLCKMIWLIPIVALKLVVNCIYCWKSLKAKLFNPPIDSRTHKVNEDLSRFVLQINDEMELAERSLKSISNSMNSFILKAEKELNIGLLELLEKSIGFDGVEKFDTDHIPHLYSVVLVNSWSLPIVTLTCIAVSLPHIPKDNVMSLVKSVGEGLSYTHLVEESLNISSEYVNIRKATITLWHEVESNCKWLTNSLSKNAFEGKTTREILNWFADKAEEVVIEINKSSNGIMMENNIPKELIAANSMYRIARTILHRDQGRTEPLSKKQLFALLNGMIADILSACFTNLPQVITMKCHESVIEKREASVKVAAKLLGKTTKILERLETLELPSMDHDKMAYIDEWRLHFNQSIP